MEAFAEMEDGMDAKHVFSQKAFDEQKMQKVNLFETERMFCDLYCFEPGQEQKTHTHAGADKIYYVLEGRGTFHIGGESRELQEHTIVIAPADIEHGVVNTSGARLVLLVYMAPKPEKIVALRLERGKRAYGHAGTCPGVPGRRRAGAIDA